ncbi:MAG: hypothetical protein ACR2G3_12850 [Solirubrobacterales bacterium]
MARAHKTTSFTAEVKRPQAAAPGFCHIAQSAPNTEIVTQG